MMMLLVKNADGTYSEKPVRGSDEGDVIVKDMAYPSGLARSRWLTAIGDTQPAIDGSAGSIAFTPGVRAIQIESFRITAGTLTLAQNTNLIVRWSAASTIDQARTDLPAAMPASSQTTDRGEVGSFMFLPEGFGLNSVIYLPEPILIDITHAISLFSLLHNLTGLTLQFGIRAVEEV